MLFNRRIWFSKKALGVAPLALVCSLAAFMLGCPKQGEFRAPTKEDNVSNVDGHGHDHDHSHEHGPNGGHIVELGPHHGEINVAADKTVTLYILDGSAKNPVAVENATAEVLINQGDVTHVLVLNPQPLDGETATKSSRFSGLSSIEPNPVTDLEGLTGKVTLKIGDETHTAELSHEEHDHDHDHDH